LAGIILLYSLFGSPSAIDCSDKILFIEDLDEYFIRSDDDELETQWMSGKH
jgi:muramoyltetrapeptide carboxypeptidase LdcA involved in peptidoglycan recycling